MQELVFGASRFNVSANAAFAHCAINDIVRCGWVCGVDHQAARSADAAYVWRERV